MEKVLDLDKCINQEIFDNSHFKSFQDVYEMLCQETYHLNRVSKSVLRFTKNGPHAEDISPVDFKKLRLKTELDYVLDLLTEKIIDLLKLK